MALKRHGVRVPAAPPCFASGTKSSLDALVNDEHRRLRPDQPHQQFGLGRRLSRLVARITLQGHAGVAVSAFAAVRFRLTARKRIPLSDGLAHSREWTE